MEIVSVKTLTEQYIIFMICSAKPCCIQWSLVFVHVCVYPLYCCIVMYFVFIKLKRDWFSSFGHQQSEELQKGEIKMVMFLIMCLLLCKLQTLILGGLLIQWPLTLTLVSLKDQFIGQ